MSILCNKISIYDYCSIKRYKYYHNNSYKASIGKEKVNNSKILSEIIVSYMMPYIRTDSKLF